MRAVSLVFAILAIPVVASGQGDCPDACCGRGGEDAINVWLIDKFPSTPPWGFIQIGIYEFNTMEDGCDETIEFWVKRECTTLPVLGGGPGPLKSWTCAVLCGPEVSCPDDGCYGCGFVSHACGEYAREFYMAGRGDLIVKWKGNVVFTEPFDFSGEPDYFNLTFTDIRFLNKNYSQIQTNDIFDALEEVAIKVEAYFEGGEPPDAVGVIFECPLTADTLVVDVPLHEFHWNTATYRGRIPPGTFRSITGDPDQTLPPYSESEILARPLALECEGEPPADLPQDILRIANFLLWVQQISFGSDFELYKDSPGTYPPTQVKIVDPVWIKDTKNDPVAYMRADTLLMNVVVQCNRIPYHDFQYWLTATCNPGQASYSTAVYEGHFYFDLLNTVYGVAPRDGPFPDYVGVIDSLKYRWWAKKIQDNNPYYFKFMNQSSHRIFITYDTPQLPEVNILGLDKICNYAQDENEAATIAELGVGGVYGEGWTYDPMHTVFSDALDVVRHTIGQCADYANLLTYLYRSIGIDANSVTIYNGCTDQGTDYWLFWFYSPERRPACVLSNELTTCDGQTAYWPFSYHATSFAAGMLCDASLGIIDTKANYQAWWRYYLQPAELDPPDPPGYVHTEPPTFEPTYYDWLQFIPHDRILPAGIVPFDSHFRHP